MLIHRTQVLVFKALKVAKLEEAEQSHLTILFRGTILSPRIVLYSFFSEIIFEAIPYRITLSGFTCS